jgi:hypothetical protein
MQDIGTFEGHSVYFTAISYTLRPIGIFCGQFGIFCGQFGIFFPVLENLATLTLSQKIVGLCIHTIKSRIAFVRTFI